MKDVDNSTFKNMFEQLKLYEYKLKGTVSRHILPQFFSVKKLLLGPIDNGGGDGDGDCDGDIDSYCDSDGGGDT
jgi:hypothetical protein